MTGQAGVAQMDNWTAGDYGGLFAGAVAALAGVAKGLAWLLNWRGEREDQRAQKLADWEASLTKREKEYRLELEGKFDAIEGEVAELRTQNGALGVSLLDVTTALRTENPTNPALARAAAVLRAAFPLDRVLPAGFDDLLAQLDKRREE